MIKLEIRGSIRNQVIYKNLYKFINIALALKNDSVLRTKANPFLLMARYFLSPYSNNK